MAPDSLGSQPIAAETYSTVAMTAPIIFAAFAPALDSAS